MTKEEALEYARSRKGDVNSSISLFYAILHDAHPSVVKIFEDRLATMLQAGNAIGEKLASLEPGSREYNEVFSLLQSLSYSGDSAKPSKGDSDG
jgi:hypothetical protein